MKFLLAFFQFVATHKDLIAKLEAIGVDGEQILQAFINHSGQAAILAALQKLLADAQAAAA